MPAFLSLFLPGKFAKEKKLHVSRPSRRRERKMERKNGRMIRIQRKPGPCLRDMLICKNSPVLPMAFVYAFVCRPSFAAVINAANKGNKFDSIEIIFKRGTKWELFPSKELDFSVFLQCYSCQWFLLRNKIFDSFLRIWNSKFDEKILISSRSLRIERKLKRHLKFDFELFHRYFLFDIFVKPEDRFLPSKN